MLGLQSIIDTVSLTFYTVMGIYLILFLHYLKAYLKQSKITNNIMFIGLLFLLQSCTNVEPKYSNIPNVPYLDKDSTVSSVDGKLYRIRIYSGGGGIDYIYTKSYKYFDGKVSFIGLHTNRLYIITTNCSIEQLND